MNQALTSPLGSRPASAAHQAIADGHHVMVMSGGDVDAGKSLLVLYDGQRLAKMLRLDRRLRIKALPTSVSIPWGLNVGVVG